MAGPTGALRHRIGVRGHSPCRARMRRAPAAAMVKAVGAMSGVAPATMPQHRPLAASGRTVRLKAKENGPLSIHKSGQAQNDAKLHAVAKQFDAMFMTEMMHHVRPQSNAAGVFAPSAAERSWQVFMDQALGQAAASGGGSGLVTEIEKSLRAAQGHTPEAPTGVIGTATRTRQTATSTSQPTSSARKTATGSTQTPTSSLQTPTTKGSHQ